MKKGFSPLHSVWALLVFSAITFLYFSDLIWHEKGIAVGWKITVMALALVFTVLQIIATIIIFKRKKQSGDEFTTKIIFKAGYFAFVSVAFSVSVLFLALAVIRLAVGGIPLNEVLNIHIVLGIIAFIQMLGALIFMISYHIMHKSGDLK